MLVKTYYGIGSLSYDFAQLVLIEVCSTATLLSEAVRALLIRFVVILLWENGVGHIWWGQAVGVFWSKISLVLSNGSSVGHSGLMSIVHAVLVGCKVAVVERTKGLCMAYSS